ncbi:MAG: 4-hydroxybenzoate octaprenyltransferase [Rickettsiales bacterium]
MQLSNPYLRLMRLHQPVGIWLLFWPCAWSMVVASRGNINLYYLFLFFIGSIAMRSAGCIVNDIIDRNLDKYVERTRNRPLASGELQISQAIALLIMLLSVSVLIALQLGVVVMIWGALALIPIVCYPFMKRISWWPQLFLGLVFNWGAFMGWAAVRGYVELPAVVIYISGVLITIGYDTIYAHQDKDDDVKIGIRSTALRLGNDTKKFVSLCYLLAIVGFVLATGKYLSILTLLPAVFHGIWQIYYLDINKPDSARKVFLSNSIFGLIVFLSLFISVLI